MIVHRKGGRTDSAPTRLSALALAVAVAVLIGGCAGGAAAEHLDGEGVLQAGLPGRVISAGLADPSGPPVISFGMSVCANDGQTARLEGIRPGSIDPGVEFLGAFARWRSVFGANKMLGALEGFPPVQDGEPFFDNLQPVEGFVVDNPCSTEPVPKVTDLVIGLRRVDERGGIMKDVLIDYEVDGRPYTLRVRQEFFFCGAEFDDSDYCGNDGGS